MCAKGFGQSQPTKIDKLVENAVRYCHKRHPEALDKIFDNLPVNFTQQVVTGILAAFQKDIDTLSWFCGYMASEINRTQDNQKPHHPIACLYFAEANALLAAFKRSLPQSSEEKRAILRRATPTHL